MIYRFHSAPKLCLGRSETCIDLIDVRPVVSRKNERIHPERESFGRLRCHYTVKGGELENIGRRICYAPTPRLSTVGSTSVYLRTRATICRVAPGAAARDDIDEDESIKEGLFDTAGIWASKPDNRPHIKHSVLNIQFTGYSSRVNHSVSNDWRNSAVNIHRKEWRAEIEFPAGSFPSAYDCETSLMHATKHFAGSSH